MIEQAINNLTEAINKNTSTLEKIASMIGVELEQGRRTAAAQEPINQGTEPSPLPAPAPAPAPKKARSSSKKETPAPAPAPEPEPEAEADIDELFGLEEEEVDVFDPFDDAKKQTNALEMFKIACSVLKGPKNLQNTLASNTKKILTGLGVTHTTLTALDAKTVEAFRPLFFEECEKLYAQGL